MPTATIFRAQQLHEKESILPRENRLLAVDVIIAMALYTLLRSIFYSTTDGRLWPYRKKKKRSLGHACKKKRLLVERVIFAIAHYTAAQHF